MAIIGFSFTKMQAEKRSPVHGQININNNVAVTDLQDANLSMAQSKKGLKLLFAFTSTFEPDLGSLQLDGEVILLEDTKVAEELLSNWQKSKSLPPELMPIVLNAILERCNIQALIMARDIGLPAPIPLPKVNMQNMPAAKPAEKKAAPEQKAEKPKKAKK